jgi:diguanylate cyclase (GGDEF)-like protein
MMLAFPRLLNSSVSIPLESLLAGIHKIEKGNLDLSIPVRNEDEIGLVTQHFNTMTTRINDLVTDLENRVTERTKELSAANLNLHQRLDEINLLQAELKEQSIRDPLTNAFNRRWMMEILEMELSRSKREKSPLSLIMIDVDYFKDFNDRFGHQAGDLILQRLVELVNSQIRKEDSICRYGGEEFMIILPKASQKDAKNRAEELRKACEEMVIDYDTRQLSITISLGVVENSNHSTNSDEILKMADKALYLAKDSGRNCVSVFSHLQDKGQRSLFS